jgi:hypothetical protein
VCASSALTASAKPSIFLSSTDDRTTRTKLFHDSISTGLRKLLLGYNPSLATRSGPQQELSEPSTAVMSGTSTKPPLSTAPKGQAGATASIVGLVSPHASASTTPQTVLDNLSRPILEAPTAMASASSTSQQQAKEDIEMKDKDDDDDDLIFVSERPLSSPQKRTFGANTSAARRSTFSSLEFSVPNAQYKTEPAATGRVNLDHLLMKLERDRKSVLGKRERADTPAIMLSPELFEEVTLVNGMFRRQCMNFVDEPATFSLCVAGFHDWEVLLAFPDNYPKVPPIVAKAPDGKHSTTVYELTKEILSREEYKDGKPMLERLMRKLVEMLAKRLPNIPWKHMPGRGASLSNPTSFLSTQDLSYVGGRRPTYIEIEQHMNALRAASAQYPPKLPVFKHREGWSTAFVSILITLTVLILRLTKIDFRKVCSNPTNRWKCY